MMRLGANPSMLYFPIHLYVRQDCLLYTHVHAHPHTNIYTSFSQILGTVTCISKKSQGHPCCKGLYFYSTNDTFLKDRRHMKLHRSQLLQTWHHSSPHSFGGASVQSVSSVAHSCPTPCNPMDCITPGLPVHHQLPGLAQTHVH